MTCECFLFCGFFIYFNISFFLFSIFFFPLALNKKNAHNAQNDKGKKQNTLLTKKKQKRDITFSEILPTSQTAYLNGPKDSVKFRGVMEVKLGV